MARKQSCPNGVALGPACPGAEAAENPNSSLDGGSKHSLACSTSLNHPDPAREEANMEGDAPILPKGLCADRSELILLNCSLFLP